jgi:hypothetical protein
VRISAVAVFLLGAIVLAGTGCGGDDESASGSSADNSSARETTSPTSTPTGSDTAAGEAYEDYEIELATATVLSRRRFEELPPASPDDVEAFARRLLAVGGLHHEFADDVEELDPPPPAARAHEAHLAAVRKQGDAYRSAGRLGLAESATEETVVELRRRLDEAMASDRATARARRALTDTLP